MKRLFVYFFLFFLFVFTSVKSQVNQTTFWLESFGLGCNQGQVAAGFVATPTNGIWVATNTGPNGAAANEWFISATEAGRPVGTCGDGCLNNAGFTNRSLHVGQNLILPALDAGAFYTQAANSETNKRMESPVANCTGKNNIMLNFDYMAVGNPTVDACEVLYSIANGPWQSLGFLSSTPGPCAPTAQWTATTYALPAACDGVNNLRVGFVWTNTNVPGPGAVAVAIDNVELTAPQITYTVPAQVCANFTWQPTPTNTVAPTDSYSWTSSPGGVIFTPSNVANPAILIPAPGIYTLTSYATNLGVLTSSVSFTVNAVAQLNFTATASPTLICPNETTTLNVVGGTNHTWTPGPLFGTPVLATPSVPTVFTVSGTDLSGCPGSGTVLVTMGQFPLISVVATASAVCVGFQSTLTAAGAGSYTWSGTGIAPPIASSSIVVGPGIYTVEALTNGLPCAAYTVVNITLAPPLNLQLSTSPQTATTCIAANYPATSKPVNLCATGAGVYLWNPTSSLNYSIGPCVAAKPLVSTCYTVTGYTSVCSGSAIVCVTVIPQFSMNVVPKQPYMCVGDSLSMYMTQITSSYTPHQFYWTEPANAPPPSLTNPLSQTVVISPTNMAQPVTYSAEVVDGRGCASVPKYVPVTVLPQPLTAIALPIVNGLVTNSICYVGSSTGSNPAALINVLATNSNSNVLPPGVVPTYTWISPYSPTYSQASIPVPVNDFSVILAAPLRTPGIVTFSVQSGYNGIPVDGKGCKRMDTVSIRVVDCRSLTTTSAQFTTSIPNDTICSRTCITFVNLTDTAAGGPQTYTWTFAGGQPSISNAMNPTICYNLPGNYNVVLHVRNPYTNTVTGSYDFEARMNYIKVVDVPNPKILPFLTGGKKDTTIRYGQSITLTATNCASYEWDPNYNISATTGSVVTVTPRKTTAYHVWGYASKACYSSDTINIIVLEDCGETFIPNAFSPNNDGANDVLYVRGYCLETMTFMIFNKWGQKVFETNDKEVGWDGTFKGEPLNTDVFVYRVEGITFDGKAFSQKGNVTLIR
ncbi:MAG: gliding motility-associated C-terminal domain-containing protein [Sphingobacteriaceae bacterium]|nr:gliding motility-associated C-terminal domain-containing protein [Sphingobacteriaceae bacterium]